MGMYIITLVFLSLYSTLKITMIEFINLQPKENFEYN